MIDVRLACHIPKFFLVNIHFLKMQFYRKTIAFFKNQPFLFLGSSGEKMSDYLSELFCFI